MSKAYEVTAEAKAGREGLVKTLEGSLELFLGSPIGIGQKTDKNNPEQLLAAAYAGCFSGALGLVAKRNGVDIKESPVQITIQLDADDVKGFNIYAGIAINFSSAVPADKTELLAREAHNLCPFSKMLKKENIIFLKVNGKDIL